MTIPVEELRALVETRTFLLDLLNPKVTPKVPKDIRRRAARCIHHYPFPTHVHALWEPVIRNYEEAVLGVDRDNDKLKGDIYYASSKARRKRKTSKRK